LLLHHGTVSLLDLLAACRRIHTWVVLGSLLLNLLELCLLRRAEKVSDIDLICFVKLSLILLILLKVVQNHLLNVLWKVLDVNLSKSVLLVGELAKNVLYLNLVVIGFRLPINGRLLGNRICRATVSNVVTRILRLGDCSASRLTCVPGATL